VSSALLIPAGSPRPYRQPHQEVGVELWGRGGAGPVTQPARSSARFNAEPL